MEGPPQAAEPLTSVRHYTSAEVVPGSFWVSFWLWRKISTGKRRGEEGGRERREREGEILFYNGLVRLYGSLQLPGLLFQF